MSGKKLDEFFDNYHAILRDFSDFKKVNEPGFPTHDLFFKLATKEMFFVVRIPSKTAFLSGDTTKLQVDFYLMREKHVQLAERIKELPYHRYFVSIDTPDIFLLTALQHNLTR